MTQTKNIMPKHYQQLQSFERGQIESLTRLGFGVRQIASRLHRSPSTISRELKRGLTTQIDSQTSVISWLLCRARGGLLSRTAGQVSPQRFTAAGCRVLQVPAESFKSQATSFQCRYVCPLFQSSLPGLSLPINGYGLSVYRGWQAPGASQL